MRRFRLATVLGLVASLLLYGAARATDWYVIPNSLTAGSISFTETYPKAASRQSHHSQFHSNPYTSVWCYDPSGTYIGGGQTVVDTKDTITGGFLAVTFPLDLPAGDCSANLGYWTYDPQTAEVTYNQVAFVFFTLGG